MTSGFRIRLFGKPALEGVDGVVVAGLPKKAYVIAAMVSLSARGGCGKPELAELFWPDLRPAQRANNLRQLLFRVRQFEDGWGARLFEADDRYVKLAKGIGCDLIEFAATSSGDPASGPEPLLELYGGRLLDEMTAGSQAAHRWLSDQRLQLEDQFVDALLAATDDLPPNERRRVLSLAIGLAPTAIGPRKALLHQLIVDGATQEARRQYREIQHIFGHGVIALPKEWMTDPGAPGPAVPRQPPVPLSQVGRDLAGIPHIALLPPRGGTAEVGDLLAAAALIDDVTIALTRLRSISVLAPHTARKVASGEDITGSVLARADFVLRTKLVARGSKARGSGPHLSLMLERSALGDIVWADGLDLDAQASPIQFASMANGIALTLVDQVERATLRAFQVPAEAGAYGHYLMGQQALQVLDLPSTRRARASFKAALALSPNLAPAHTGYAQSMIYEWVIRGRGDHELVSRARQAAERARDIDPLFGAAHQMLGRSSLFGGDFVASLAHFEKAESLNPHHADLLCDFADTLMHSSLAERANDKIELALKLNPLAPDAYWWASAGIKFFVGEYDDALIHLGRVKNSEPVLRLTAACAAMAGQHELSRLARKRFLAMDPGFKLDEWIAVIPLRDPSHRRQYRQALQKAGFK